MSAEISHGGARRMRSLTPGPDGRPGAWYEPSGAASFLHVAGTGDHLYSANGG